MARYVPTSKTGSFADVDDRFSLTTRLTNRTFSNKERFGKSPLAATRQHPYSTLELRRKPRIAKVTDASASSQRADEVREDSLRLRRPCPPPDRDRRRPRRRGVPRLSLHRQARGAGDQA